VIKVGDLVTTKFASVHGDGGHIDYGDICLVTSQAGTHAIPRVTVLTPSGQLVTVLSAAVIKAE